MNYAKFMTEYIYMYFGEIKKWTNLMCIQYNHCTAEQCSGSEEDFNHEIIMFLAF